MRLSELKTGESATILKFLGHGGFRRRITEMGFVRGQRVEVILNAPLKDPIEYKIMGYQISLRRSEAEMIVVLSDEEVKQEMAKAPQQEETGRQWVIEGEDSVHYSDSKCESCCCKNAEEVISREKHRITVALVGNPNSGKTSLFNAISGGREHVGNYGGVTVDAKLGH